MKEDKKKDGFSGYSVNWNSAEWLWGSEYFESTSANVLRNDECNHVSTETFVLSKEFWQINRHKKQKLQGTYIYMYVRSRNLLGRMFPEKVRRLKFFLRTVTRSDKQSRRKSSLLKVREVSLSWYCSYLYTD